MTKVIQVSDEIAEILTEIAHVTERRDGVQNTIDYYQNIIAECIQERDNHDATIRKLTMELGTFVLDRPITILPDLEVERVLTVGDRVRAIRLVNYMGEDISDYGFDLYSVGVIDMDWNDGDVHVTWPDESTGALMKRSNLVPA